MSDHYQRQLITTLLDKYERSSFFRDGTQPTRKIMIKLYDGGQTDFPQYDIEQAEKRTLINQAAFSLSDIQLVSYQWMKGEEQHIIARVWLNYENLFSAYKFAGRQPKNDMIDSVCLKLLDALEHVHSDWAKEYLSYLYSIISKKKYIGNLLPNNEIERDGLIHTICFIDQMSETEMLERVFSLKCLGDSKKFEKSVKPRLLSVLRKYLDTDDDATDEVLLKEVGIVKYPEQFEFCGDATFSFEKGKVDFSHLYFGSTICLADLQRSSLYIAPSIDRVLSIENRANYIDYIYKYKADNELVLFHSGQYSPSKRKFFIAISDAMPNNCRWYHWGDIDYGGFSMLSRLRREIRHDIIPYRMDTAELKRYSTLLAPINTPYANKLQRLTMKAELNDCFSCINYMIENKVRLEQEAMLTNSTL